VRWHEAERLYFNTIATEGTFDFIVSGMG